MKKFVLAILLLLVCASPAFAWHKKAHKDPRVVQHPKVNHPRNQAVAHPLKHKPVKHKV
jgi:hypothetical protein